MHISLIAAITIDGFIGRSADDRSFDWTSPEDKKHYISHIKSADAIVMGRTTFETVQRYPNNSRWIIYTSSPETFDNPAPERIQLIATALPPAELVSQLEAEGVTHLTICGGSSIYTQFLQADLVDRLHLTVEPVVFGSGISLFSDAIAKPLQQAWMLREQRLLNDDSILLTYDRKERTK